MSHGCYGKGGCSKSGGDLSSMLQQGQEIKRGRQELGPNDTMDYHEQWEHVKFGVET